MEEVLDLVFVFLGLLSFGVLLKKNEEARSKAV